MASIDLTSNSREITSAYDSIVHGDPSISWAVFTYGAGFNSGTLKLQSTGAGDIDEFQDEFSDGKVQYAFARVVTDSSTNLSKFVLIGWCGDGVPERAKGYFPTHFASVAKLFHGYHVQITARSEDDIEPSAILKKIEDASGAKYSFVESMTRFQKAPPVRPKYTSAHATSHADESDWGDAPPVTKTEVTKVAPAWKPVKVDLDAIRKSFNEERRSIEPVRSAYQPIGKVDVAAIRASASKNELDAEKPEVVKSSYQPIGKVDIAAIRATASKKELETEKPEVIKSSYQPIGKVDLDSIRAQAKQAESAMPSFTRAKSPELTSEEPPSLKERSKAFNAEPSGRLYEMPKPKVNKPALASRFGGSSAFGTAPPMPSDSFKEEKKTTPGFNNFVNEGGKTPAQIWAERKAKAAGGSTTSSSSTTTTALPKTFGAPWSAPKSPLPVAAADDDKVEEEAEELKFSNVAAMRERLAKASMSDEEEEESAFDRPESPIRLAKPVSSSTIIRPGGLPARPLPPKESPEPESEEEPLPETEPERGPEPEVEEEGPTPPALNYSSRPSYSKTALPERQPEPEVEEEEREEEEEEEEKKPVSAFAQGRAAAANALASGGIMGGPAPVRQHAPEPELEIESPAERSGKTAVVLYDYHKDEDNEINLTEGEIVYDIEELDDGWWAGHLSSGEYGLFPSNYVELQEDGAGKPSAATEPAAYEPEEAPASADVPKGPSAIASYDYEAQEDNELSFPEGAVIEDLQFPDEDWWSGVYNGERKLFPANYVELQ
ncbi:hypothetical protein V1512DRAFT_251763 [Lipomyces arxii]|uniref:uncharacterized protein n=1 Tax=Lipomyces arxii TaxID=56418 RepID=UPI0034CD997F